MVRFTKHSPQKCEVYKALWRKWLPGVTEKWEERENYQLWELKVAHTGNCWSWLNHNDPQNIFAGSKFVVIWELEIWGEGIMWRVLLWDCVWVCVCVCVTHCGIFFKAWWQICNVMNFVFTEGCKWTENCFGSKTFVFIFFSWLWKCTYTEGVLNMLVNMWYRDIFFSLYLCRCRHVGYLHALCDLACLLFILAQ